MKTSINSDPRVIVGQHIDRVKLERARALRHDMTPAERCLWDALRDKQLDGLHFRRQQIIDGFIVDFYCHAARLVVEVDGGVHERQVEYDAERSRILERRHLLVLRVTNIEVIHHLPAVLAQIRKVAQEQQV